MRLISFDPYRTLGIPGLAHIKPEEMFRRRAEIQDADWALFPEEWQLNALVYALKCRVFPSVPSDRLGQDKVQFTRALWASCPERAPEAPILRATPEAMSLVWESLRFPLVVKEPRSSMGLGVHRVEQRRDLLTLLPSLPVLYAQEYLANSRDLRVVWVGGRVVGAYWRTGSDGFHHNLARGGVEDFTDIPQEPLDLVASFARHLGIDCGGFDLAESQGHWYFIELSTKFGNAALNRLGIQLGPLILDYLGTQTSPHDHPRQPPVGVAV